MVRRRIEVLVDADQSGMIGIASGDRMVFQRTETARANATCSALLISWSRRNSTLCASSASLIAPNRSSFVTASARLTPTSSAPMCVVSFSTFIR